MKSWFVYVLRCGDRSLYTGIARDVRKRLAMHRSGNGSKYVRSRGACRLVLEEKHPSRSSALKRECEIKRMRRPQKLALVKGAKMKVWVLFFLLAAGTAMAAEDPNAVLRRTGPPVDPALAEFERVKKINNDLAIAHFTTVIQKNPKDIQAYLKRGKAYRDNRNYDQALADYDHALGLDPNQAEAYVGKAVCHFFRDELDKSWDSVHKAESLGGKFWPAFKEALEAKSGRKK